MCLASPKQDGPIDVKLKTYEARLYNQWVRLLLDSGERNVTGFSDAWSETRYVEIRAESLECAARLLSRDYPPEVGFVVSGIEELPDPDVVRPNRAE